MAPVPSPYEIYVSPAGIRVCSDDRDRCFRWDVESPVLETCHGHNTGPEAPTPGNNFEGGVSGGRT